MEVFSVKGLKKSFQKNFYSPKQLVLKGFDFSIKAGAITGFLGANGAGKTTTMKCMLGLVFPDEAEFNYFGEPTLTSATKKKLGFLPERPYFYQYLTGHEFLVFYGSLTGGITKKVLKSRADDLLKKMGLWQARDKALRDYSKGMLQKVGLAQALIHEPELVVLDEPMSGLDPDGRKAMNRFESEHFDLIVLDIMLPELNGLQVCEQIRLTNTKVPILMLTAKGEPQDRVEGLKKGADDYLAKPFVLEEFLLRVNNLIKRTSTSPENTPNVYGFGSNKVNFLTYEATGVNGKFTLTKREAMLIKLLIERKNEVVSRQQILQSVWGYDVFPSTRTIDNFILSFRKNFEQDQRNPKYFHSVRGVGYRFTP